jgi:hypothetical protein
MSTDSTVFFCSQTRQKNQRNEASRLFKRAQRYLNIKHGEVSLQIESAALPPKPQPLYEMKMKRKLENKENAVRLMVHV